MQPARHAPILVLLASVVIVGTALLSQYVGGLQPCELCLYERWPYYAVILLLVLALVSGKRRLIRIAQILSVVIFAGSFALALYHVGVERHWVEGPTACTGALGNAASPEALLQALQARQVVQCDVVQWSFHGLSLAGLNLIVSFALAAFSLWALTQPRRGGWS
jgi:disulfide bond formation protein DsbB